MITTCNTQQRIIKAMERGAQLVFHVSVAGPDGYSRVSKVTLERGNSVLTLTTKYRQDEYFFVPCHEDGRCWLRHGEYSRPESGKQIAEQIIEHSDIRSEYAGYRGDYDRNWRELYVHKNQPVPTWVTEQWGLGND